MSGGAFEEPYDGQGVGRLVTVAGGGVTDPPDLVEGKSGAGRKILGIIRLSRLGAAADFPFCRVPESLEEWDTCFLGYGIGGGGGAVIIMTGTTPPRSQLVVQK